MNKFSEINHNIIYQFELVEYNYVLVFCVDVLLNIYTCFCEAMDLFPLDLQWRIKPNSLWIETTQISPWNDLSLLWRSVLTIVHDNTKPSWVVTKFESFFRHPRFKTPWITIECPPYVSNLFAGAAITSSKSSPSFLSSLICPQMNILSSIAMILAEKGRLDSLDPQFWMILHLRVFPGTFMHGVTCQDTRHEEGWFSHGHSSTLKGPFGKETLCISQVSISSQLVIDKRLKSKPLSPFLHVRGDGLIIPPGLLFCSKMNAENCFVLFIRFSIV